MGKLKALKTITRKLSLLFIAGAAVFSVLQFALPATTTAAAASSFSLQVSPSPLIATVEPGKTTNLDLRIRNTSDGVQDLKMGLRAFTVDSTSGQIKLENSAPKEVANFVSFESPTFSVESGALYTQRVTLAVPASAGFSYSFAITIAQQHPAKAKAGSTAINGSVAVFTLLNVNKPGATRKLELDTLSVSQHVYEYLPATLNIKLKNSGNTLAQPRGSLYIQRHSNDTKPLAVMDLNASGGYILPSSSRTLTVQWSDGFPHYKMIAGNNGQSKNQLSWQGGDISNLRIGRYVAKLVAVYDDGSRDVPLNAEITFWVIPWRFFLVITVIVAICIVGVVTILRKSSRIVHRPVKHRGNKKN